MIEVEVKYRVTEDVINQLASKILAMGGLFLGEVMQEDIYFQHPSRNFAVTDEALRVRRVENRAEVTYKGPKIDSKSKTREEIKIEISDFESFVLLLERLGFRPVARVTKKRITYKLGEKLLHLDNVEKAGFFVEIETMVERKSDVEKKRDELLRIAEKLSIPADGLERKSYLEIILGF